MPACGGAAVSCRPNAMWAFLCNHAVCRSCMQRMLVHSAESVGSEMLLRPRCPLCRAPSVPACDNPPWLRELLETDEVLAARAAAKRRVEDSAPAAVRAAGSRAAQNIAALQNLIFGSSDGLLRPSDGRLQQAIQAAAEVVVEVSYADEEDEVNLQILSDSEQRLMEEAQAEAELGGSPGAAVSAFLMRVADAYFTSEEVGGPGFAYSRVPPEEPRPISEWPAAD